MNSYEKIQKASGAYYNRGLDDALVHNLSGAIMNLKKSLHYDKNNIEARNLLGLCYYEVGECILALREWVISVNLKQEDNPAADYINDMKPDMARTGKFNQCVKKYNIALEYANQGNEDLAIIQLKKVLGTNPKFVRASLLLGLIYIHQGQYKQAKAVLSKAAKVDANNTLLLKYEKEAEEHLENKKKKKKDKEGSVEYKSGSETIIRPAYLKENSTIGTMVNIIFGLVVGFLISFFLVVPGVKRSATASSAAKLVEANNTISTRNVTIRNLQEEIDALNGKVKKAENTSSESESNMNVYKKLLEAYVQYTEGEYEKAGDALKEVKESKVEDDFKDIYELLAGQVNDKYLKILYKRATAKYNQGSYEDAIEIFEDILKIQEDYGDGDAMFICAHAYRMNGDDQKAIVLYQKIISKYPDSYKATNSQTYIDQIKGE
ncbi:MAG: tetratricopeptide repeat protein [Lachnospiraceae bacterium]|nr:tetratricopeptide repeat protein [Lachnospiraceae bacterium]